MKEPINMSEWTLDRIQAEQDKHMGFKVTGVIPTVDRQQIELNLDPMESALDAYIHKVTEDTDMYIICEIAKLYIESQRPAEWIEHEDERWGGVWYTCSNCRQYAPYKQDDYNNWRQKLSDFCPNCGRRMKNGT